MKKILSLVAVVVIAWAGMVPAHAAPMMKESMQESGPIIECDDAQCTQVSDTMIKISMQFHYDPGNSGEGRAGWFYVREESSVYYMASWSTGYTNGSPWSTTAWPTLGLPGAAGLGESAENYHSVGAFQTITMTGSISQKSTSPVTVGHYMASAAYAEYPDVADTGSGSFDLFISSEPISDCDEYIAITTDTFEIDPTIELPVGPPTDYQTFNTTIDQVYSISVDGGPWNDGTNDRTDVAISWDAVTWMPLVEVPTVCKEQGEDGGVQNYLIAAESEIFYIRVNDTAENFANNTNNPDPMTFTISMTTLSTGLGCDTQFVYDEFEDVVGFTGVNSALSDGVLLSNDTPLVVGEWYVVKWGSGTWTDNGGMAQISMQYAWLQNTGWSVLNSDEGGGAGSAVWCQTMGGVETLIQAQATNIFLRANDQDNNFSNNSGTSYYTIYHATFDRKPEPCELIVDLGGMMEAIEVDASKWLGSPVGSGPNKIQPGQYYVLDTTLGPWNPVGGSSRYDMAIQVKSLWESIESPWGELEDFEASCNVAIDTLGHRRIIFKAPDDYGYSDASNQNTYPNGVYYRLRVDREFLGLYNGSMGWKLYGATEKQAVDDTCLDGLNLQVIDEFEWINEKSEFGDVLLSDTPRWPEYVALVPGTTYVVQSPTKALGECAGDTGSECKFQVSNDNGTNWYAVDDTISPLECSVKEAAPSTIWKARFTVQEGEVWKIRVNDMDGNFINNTGSTAFKFFKDCSGEECIPIPESDIPGISIQGGGDVCKIAIIRPSSLLDIGGWISYLNLSTLRYMAWCPKHTGILLNFMNSLRSREPFASLVEMDNIKTRIIDEVNSYEWGENAGQGESIFDMNSSEIKTKIINRLFGDVSQRSIWEGGDAVDFSETGLPDSYYSCSSVFVDSIPSGLRPGVCMVSAYFIETTASFWIQLALDITALGFAVSITWGGIKDLVYLFTGVQLRTSTKSEAGRFLRNDEIGRWERKRKGL